MDFDEAFDKGADKYPCFDLLDEHESVKRQQFGRRPSINTKYSKRMKDCIFEVSFHVFQTLDHSVRCSPALHDVLSHDGLGTSWKTLRCAQARVGGDGSVTEE